MSVPSPDDKSYIEELKKTLYSRTAPDVRTRRKLRFTESTGEPEIKTDWEHPSQNPTEPVVLNKEYQDHKMSFFTKIFIASALFCLVAVGIGAYLFFNGANLISANNIDIHISGPVSIPGGVPVSFDILTTNKNNVDLKLVDMTVDFPAGATDPNNPGQPLQSYHKLIDSLAAGESDRQTVQAVIFGEENIQKQISVSLTYSVKGSTSIFTKKQTYDVLINSSPINVTVSSFKEITSGQTFEMKVTLKSNSQDSLRNVMLHATYPFGYNLISSSLPTLSDNATWKIGDIPAGGQRTVTLKGTLTGEDTDLRAFHFVVGAANPKDPKIIGTEYMSIEQDVTIQKPFISLSIAIDSDQADGDYIGTFDQSERVTINWFNNLPDAVSNVVIDAKISGSAYDKASIQPEQGYFNSGTDDIVWNQQTNRDLAKIAAGASGSVSFLIIPRDKSTAGHPVVNPTISISANVSGNRVQESNVPESLAAAVTKNIKISSNISLSGRIVRSVGPFANSGPIPPKADVPTSYTVIWDADNTANAAGNAKVTAKLPTYVKWLNVISPTSEDLTYDQNSGLITWNIGSVNTYTLSASQRREVSFQVSFLPSISQVGQSPIIVNTATLTAIDSFTGVSLTSVQDSLSTRFSTDPSYQGGNETVTR